MHPEPIIPMKFLAAGSSIFLAALGEATLGPDASPPMITTLEIGVASLAGISGAWVFRRNAGIARGEELVTALIVGVFFAALGGPFAAHLAAAKLDWLAPGQVFTSVFFGGAIGLLSTQILAGLRNPLAAAEALLTLWRKFKKAGK